MNSIMQEEKECYITRSLNNLHKHHIYGGNGRRELSEKYGCWVWLRADWHTMSDHGVHFNKELDQKLKRLCQERFEREHSREEFIRIFGRSYL
ncbi:hypothetical protein [Anaerotruncus rubiinfantis]|jgi:hypothetical protein|uniref:hypothetical protein n=1 Tax=Anaerotruncus rubiinfantis TaxID=1720200 RepID=UPI0034A221C8